MKVYPRKPASISELKQFIVEESTNIPESTFLKVQESCLKRMLLCKQNDGNHFEQLLRKQN